ncbi:MAG: nucleotidyltransferase [Elusimicrobiales bacterium]|nr:nucleotidyltransferase [Elusimicrobiales bacterium]
MEIEKILKKILKEFGKEYVNYGLIGGFAIGIYGIIRATMDIDFLLSEKDVEKVIDITKKMGYRIFNRSDYVLQVNHKKEDFGNIDFLIARGEIGKDMLDKCVEKRVFDDYIRVLRLEDIIGLKIQSYKNDPKRYIKENYDIEWIMEENGKKLDWERIKKYYVLFDDRERYLELRERYGK